MGPLLKTAGVAASDTDTRVRPGFISVRFRNVVPLTVPPSAPSSTSLVCPLLRAYPGSLPPTQPALEARLLRAPLTKLRGGSTLLTSFPLCSHPCHST